MSTVGMALPLRPPDHHVPAVRTGHRALDYQHIVLGIDLDDFKIAHGHLRIPHVSSHTHARKHPGWEAGSPNGTRRAVEHGTVRAAAAAKMMALHHAGETAA